MHRPSLLPIAGALLALPTAAPAQTVEDTLPERVVERMRPVARFLELSEQPPHQSHLAGAEAQVDSLHPGDRVRVTARRRQSGTLFSADSNRIVLLAAGGRDTITVQTASVRKLELSRGDDSRVRGALKGALIGASVGALTALVIGITNGCLSGSYDPFASSSGSSSHHCPGAGTAAGIVLGGTAVGASIGAALPREHWVRVAIPF